MGNESLYRRNAGTREELSHFIPTAAAVACMDERMSEDKITRPCYLNGLYTAKQLRGIAAKAEIQEEKDNVKADIAIDISEETLPEPLNTMVEGLSLICESAVILHGRICAMQSNIEDNHAAIQSLLELKNMK